MDVRGAKIFRAFLVLFSIAACVGAVRSQHDCRKGAGGGEPPWFNPGKGCKFQQHTFIFAGAVGWPQRTPPETDCYVRIKVCGLDLKQNTVNPLGTICPTRRDFAEPTLCCDEFYKAVGSGQPCDPMQDADCDGIPNETDKDPLKPDRTEAKATSGGVYISAEGGAHLHETPSNDSRIVFTVPLYNGRLLYDDTFTDSSGALWYRIRMVSPEGNYGWVAASEIRCSRMPLPAGKPLKLEDTGLGNAHPTAAMATGANG